MNVLNYHQQWDALVPALLHTLWIGGICSMILAVALRYLPAVKSKLRYSLSVLSMAVTVLGGVVVWTALQQNEAALLIETATPFSFGGYSLTSPSGETAPDLTTVGKALGVEEHVDSKERLNAPAISSRTWKPTVAVIWMIGVGIMLCRFFTALMAGKRIRENSRPLENRWELEQTLEDVSSKMKIAGKVTVRLSDEIVVPAVVGFFHPLILWPSDWLLCVKGDQVIAILAHELAHIRRLDYLVNSIQMLIEALLFFNPAIWWISRQIRIEREACCDAASALIVEDPAIMAAALSRIAENTVRSRSSDLPANAVSLGSCRYALLDRVRRILKPDHRPAIRLPWTTLVTLLVFFVGLLFVAGNGVGLAVEKAFDVAAYIAEGRTIEQEFEKGAVSLKSSPQKIQIEGTILTHDGKQIPEKTAVVIRSANKGKVSVKQVKIQSDGTFRSGKLASGGISISVWANGYAYAETGGITSVAGEKISDINLELQPGYSMGFSVKNEAGKAISDVPIDIAMKIGDQFVEGRKIETNSNGYGKLEHLVDGDLTASIEMHGFLKLVHKTTTAPDKVLELILKKAIPVIGRVTDAANDQPVSGVKIWLINSPEGSGDPRNGYGERRQADYFGSDKGVILLDSLESGWPHTLWIEADSFRPEIVYGVQSGKQDFSVSLKPKIVINVTILGSLDGFPKRKGGGRELRYEQALRTTESGVFRAVTQFAPILLEDGVASAKIDGSLLAAPLTIETPNGPIDIETPSQNQSIVLGLNPNNLGSNFIPKCQKVIVKLIPPKGWPIPEGEIRMGYSSGKGMIFGRKSFQKKLKNGQASIDVLLNRSPKGMFFCDNFKAPGYWMKSQNPLEIKPSIGSKVIEIQTYPAGAIYGVVIDEKGEPVPDVSIAMNIIEAPRGMPRPDPNWWNNNFTDSEGRFMISPIPFGGVYRPECSRSPIESHAISYGKPIRVDRQNPRNKITMILPRGQGAPLALKRLPF